MGQSTDDQSSGSPVGCFIFFSALAFLGGGYWFYKSGMEISGIFALLGIIPWPYYVAVSLAIVFTVILSLIRNNPEVIDTIKAIIVACLGVLSVMTILKIGQEYIEFIPDDLFWVGHLDEAAAGALLLKCLQYFEIDVTELFDK